MVSSTNHKTVFYNPLKFSLFISLLLINAFFFTSSAFPGVLKTDENSNSYNQVKILDEFAAHKEKGRVASELRFKQAEHIASHEKALQITLARAETGNTGGNTANIKESLKFSFDPAKRIMDKGAEEVVTLRRENGGTESYTVTFTLNSTKPNIVSPVSTSVTFLGASKRVSVKIKAVQEGSTTITAVARPTKEWDNKKDLPSTRQTPTPLSDEILDNLKKKNGFRQDHAQRMNEFAQEKSVFLIVRDGNPDSVEYFKNKEYMAKQMSCKAKTAKVGKYKGLVVDPTHKVQAKAWKDAIDSAVGKEKTDLEAAKQKALDAWRLYGDEMKNKYGYRVNEETGLIEKVDKDTNKVWKGIHGDYDLHGVYRKSDDGTVEKVSYGTGQKGSRGEVLRRQLNNKLTGGGKDFVQHGGQDDWIPDPTKVPVKMPDPPATVFFPDGRPPKRLETPEQMREFYENEMGVPWQYPTPYGDKQDGDDDNGTRTAKDELSIEVGELSLKVIDLKKALSELKFKPDKRTLTGEEYQKMQRLKPDSTNQAKETGYTGVYLDTAYEAAAKLLSTEKSKMRKDNLPKEGYALLSTKEVFESIDDKRDFAGELDKKIKEMDFELFRETQTGEEVKKKIKNIDKIKNEIKSRIIEEYKKKEKAVIDKAFGEFVAIVVADNPEMKERLISAQAFYDIYKEKKGNIEVQLAPYMNKLIMAKQFVNAAVHLYNDGPKAVFKIILIKIVKKKCYEAMALLDDTVVVAGSQAGGPIGGFAAYIVKKSTDYLLCDLLIDEFFSESVVTVYSKDGTINDYVKIFYTGETPDTVVEEQPYDVNFYSRFGWKREEILEKTKNDELLDKALKQHLSNLWRKYPDKRVFLDISGDSPTVTWDNKKGKEIWQIILETANKDMIRAFEKKLEQIKKPERSSTEIENYMTRETRDESESWFFAGSKSYAPQVEAELPRKAGGGKIPEEVSMGETLNMEARFMVLGLAGQDETITIQWDVRRLIGSWFYDETIVSKEEEDITVKFPIEKVKEVAEHIKIKEHTYDLTIDKERFVPGASYRVVVVLKYKTKVLSVVSAPFKVKPEEKEEDSSDDDDDDDDNGGGGGGDDGGRGGSGESGGDGEEGGGEEGDGDGEGEDEDEDEDEVDADGDGYTTEAGDCNDNNAAVNPAATEVCDGMDNNCDNQVDEGVMTTYYQDSDGDGYGNPAATNEACEPPTGYVLDNTDCNDAIFWFNPAAVEVCDGEDNNCDNQIDEGVMTTYYQDSDGDGYGNPDVTIEACEQPTGYVIPNTDCNDANALFKPGATEIPYDGIDQDCDGSDLVDVDGDGYRAVQVAGGNDCRDSDATVYPGANDIPNDGIDQDCDGSDAVDISAIIGAIGQNIDGQRQRDSNKPQFVPPSTQEGDGSGSRGGISITDKLDEFDRRRTEETERVIQRVENERKRPPVTGGSTTTPPASTTPTTTATSTGIEVTEVGDAPPGKCRIVDGQLVSVEGYDENIAGVSITLSGPVNPSTTSSGSGSFNFQEIPSGDYIINVNEWNYGMTKQNFTAPSGKAVKIVLKGSCPFLYVWTGERYEKENDIYSVARIFPSELYSEEASLLAEKDGVFLHQVSLVNIPEKFRKSRSYRDFYMITKALIPDSDGNYLLKIKEQESEHSFTDIVELLFVDHKAENMVGITRGGNPFLYKTLNMIDNWNDLKGNACDPGQSMGLYNDDGLEIKIPQEAFSSGVLAITWQGFQVGKGSGHATGDGRPKLSLQRKRADGSWQTVDWVYPRDEVQQSFFVLEDLGAGWDDGGKVRLIAKSCLPEKYHRIDQIAWSKCLREVPLVESLSLVSAIKSNEENVRAQLLAADGNSLRLGPKEEVLISFKSIPLEERMERTVFLITEGFYIPVPMIRLTQN